MGALQKVKSSFIAGVGYDPDKRVLTVAHRNGATYHYHNVGPAVHEALMEADSIGTFINSHIRGQYRESQ